MLSLGFFNAYMLWALPLAAVPIIIHLLNRRRFNKIPWAAMEYLLRALRLFGQIATATSSPGTKPYYRAFILVPGGTEA